MLEGDGNINENVFVNATCVYDSLISLLKDILGNEKSEDEMRQEYFAFMKKYYPKVSAEELFGGIRVKYIDEFSEYLGFKVESYDAYGICDSIINKGKTKTEGIMVIKQGDSSGHAVSVKNFDVNIDVNGKIDGLGFRCIDKNGNLTGQIIMPDQVIAYYELDKKR